MQFLPPFDQIAVVPPGPWQNANPSAGIRGSIPNADVFAAVQNEIVNVIDARGLTPSGTDCTQLFQAIRTGELNLATGTADAMVIDPAFAYTSLPSGTVVAVLTPGAPGTANQTATPNLTVNNVGPWPIRNQNGGALAPGDLPAGGCRFYVSGGNHFRTVGSVPSDFSSAPVSTATLNLINSLTPRGANEITANTAGLVENDIASSGYTIVEATRSFTGASYVDSCATCAIRDLAGSGSEGGGTARLILTDLTAGGSLASEYVGGGSYSQNTQIPLVNPRVIFILNPAHAYTLSLALQKGSSDGQVEVFDAYIFALTDGN